MTELNSLPRRAPQLYGVFYPAKYRKLALHCLSAMNRGLLLTSALAVSRSITGCFVLQNIGEVARSDGGVKKVPATVVTELNLTSQKSYAPFHPLPYTANAAQEKRVKTGQ